MKFIRITILLIAMVFSASAQTATGTINFKWEPNSEPDLAGYKFYTEELDQSGAIISSSSVEVGSTTTYAKKGLIPNKRYRFSVTAYNAGQLESDRSNYVIIETAVSLATEPKDLKVVVSNDAAVVSWSPNPAIEEIIRYDVKVIGRSPTDERSFQTKETSIGVPIEPGQYYTVIVTAVGPESTASSQTMILGKLSAPKRVIFEGKITWEFE